MRQQLADLSPDLLFAASRDGQLLEVNTAWEKGLGWLPGELQSGSIHSLWHPDDRPAVELRWTGLVEGAQVLFDARVRARDGSHRPFSWSLQATASGVAGSGRDTLSQQLVHELSRGNEDRFQRAYEGSPFGMALVSRDFRFESVNSALCKMLGYERHELVGRGFLDVTHADDAMGDVDEANLLSRGEAAIVRRLKRYRRKDGRDFWAHTSVSLVRGPDGRALSGLAIVDDASGEHRAADMYEKLRLLFESAAEGIYGVDGQGKVAFINPAGARILGWQPDELVGQEQHGLAKAVVAEPVALARKDGQSVAVELSAYPVMHAGQPAGVVGSFVDVSVRKRAEEALRKTHGILNAVIEGTTDVVTVTDQDGRCLLLNAAGARYFGAEPEGVLGRDASAFFSEETAKAFREHDRIVMDGNEARTFEETVTRGETTWTFLSTKGPYRDHRGQVVGVIAIARDITDRKRMEATLRLQAEALQLLQTIAIAANEAPSVEEAIRVALARMCAHARWSIGCALMRTRTGGPMRLAAWHQGLGHLEETQADELARFATNFELPARVFTQNKPEWIPDLESLPDRPRAKAARSLGVRGAFGLPVSAGGEVLAVLLLLSTEPIEPDAPLIVVLSNAGAQLGLVVQRKRGEETLRASEERSRLILETATDAFIGLDADGRILEWNRQAAETFGLLRELALGKSLCDTLLPAGAREAVELRTLFATGEGPALGTRIELTALRSDGKQFPVEMTIWAAPAGSAQRYNAFVHDITSRKRAEEQLRKANEQLTSWVGELERRNREVSLLNEMGDLLQSCLSAEEAHGVVAQFVQQLFPEESGALFILSRPRNALDAVCAWGVEQPTEKMLAPEDCWSLRRGRMHAVGTGAAAGPRCKHLTPPLAQGPTICVPLLAQGEALGMLFLQEPHVERSAHADHATEARRRLALTLGEHISLSLANFKLRETLRDQSIRDALTGLYNRRYMEETLDREMRRAERKQRTLGLILIDVDHFKNYNDAMGHEAGDALLRALADFLRTQVRREDVVCRFGGEEFTLVLPEATLEIARERAENLREKVKELRVEHRGLQLGSVTLSLGVALYPNHGANAEEIFRSADAALYRAKAQGRDRVEMGRPPESALSGETTPVRRIH